jgi:hypothetical protein
MTILPWGLIVIVGMIPDKYMTRSTKLDRTAMDWDLYFNQTDSPLKPFGACEIGSWRNRFNRPDKGDSYLRGELVVFEGSFDIYKVVDECNNLEDDSRPELLLRRVIREIDYRDDWLSECEREADRYDDGEYFEAWEHDVIALVAFTADWLPWYRSLFECPVQLRGFRWLCGISTAKRVTMAARRRALRNGDDLFRKIN